MTIGRYAEGVAAFVVTMSGITLAAIALRRRFFPEYRRDAAYMADLALAIAVLLGIAEVLGMLGLLHLLPVVLTAGALGLIGLRSLSAGQSAAGGRLVHKQADPYRAIRVETSGERYFACGVVALVAAEWTPATIHSLRFGMTNVDSLWYHMPLAAQFAQSGSILPVHNIDNDNIIQFYPASSEVFHAIGIVLLGTDVLSPLLNWAWLALALFAAWSIGRRHGVGSLALTGAAIVFGTPEWVADEPGGAYNDVVGVALLLAALALLVADQPKSQFRLHARYLILPSIAAGMTAGVKYTYLLPVLALTIWVVANLPRGSRLTSGTTWCLGVFGGGSLWYLRNAIVAGNPIPDLHLRLGPVSLPRAPAEAFFAPLHFVGHSSIWSSYIFPALSEGLGPAWWSFGVVAVVGLVLGIWSFARLLRARWSTGDASGVVTSRDRTLVLLATVGSAQLLGYLITPQPNLPVSFVYDLRFTFLTFVLGAVAIPIALSESRLVLFLLPIYGCTAIATQFASGIWSGSGRNTPTLVPFRSVALGVIAGAAVLVAAWALSRLRRRSVRLRSNAGGIASVTLVCALLVGGFLLESFYVSHWYTRIPLPRTDRWANAVHGARIGVGDFSLAYTIYGSDLTNRVQYVATQGARGEFFAPKTCSAWREAVNRAHDQFLIVPSAVPLTPTGVSLTAWWTKTDPAAHLITTDPVIDGAAQLVDVFGIKGRMDPSCS